MFEDPLQWWKIYGVHFPIMSRLARKYLAIPATSTKCERIFSDSANIITEKRNRLEEDIVRASIILYENYDEW